MTETPVPRMDVLPLPDALLLQSSVMTVMPAPRTAAILLRDALLLQ